MKNTRRIKVTGIVTLLLIWTAVVAFGFPFFGNLGYCSTKYEFTHTPCDPEGRSMFSWSLWFEHQRAWQQ